MTTPNAVRFGPYCCIRCFASREVRKIVRLSSRKGDCEFCKSTQVATTEVFRLVDFFEPLLRDYLEVQEGVHFIAALDQEADGETLDALFAEDNPGVFADRLSADERQNLMQAIVDAIDKPDPSDGSYGRTVAELWTKPGNEIWAGADEEYFRSPSYRWRTFTEDIKSRQRFAREQPGDESDPAEYLTPAILDALTVTIGNGTSIYRAVLDGVRNRGEIVGPHSAERMRGPRPEHCRRGGRVNPPGIPVLYTATEASTAIAEVRPWKGAPVSVASMRALADLRVVDFVPRPYEVRDENRLTKHVEGLHEVLSSIGRAMAEPIDPDDTEVQYVPTQYVAEFVKSKGFDGLRYGSAMAAGANIALFDLGSVEIDSIHLYGVTDVVYTSIRRDPPTMHNAAHVVPELPWEE